MKKINKLSVIFFAAFLAISSTACSSNANSDSSAAESSVQVESVQSETTSTPTESTVESSQSSEQVSAQESIVISESRVEPAEESSQNSTQESSEEEKDSSTEESSEPDQVKTVKMNISGYSFTAELENNDTANAFYNTLPMTVSMTELNGNEKYTDLNYSLLKDAPSNPQTINEGDLMLFRDSTVVLFYDTFDTEYSYVKLGKISDTAQLKKAVGTGDITVEFTK